VKLNSEGIEKLSNKNMDQSNEPSTSKAKGISELHFNAINNNASFRSNKSSSDQLKLIPSNTKYVISSQQTSPTHLNGGHKTISSIPSEGPSTDPSSTTSPILSPATSRPKHYNSTRSLRSGLCYNINLSTYIFSLFNYA